jgi:LysR family glycine cleavage system transcriptional activator
MKELEALLGVRLFERKSRSLELTTAGQTLRDEVEPLLEALESSLALISRRTHRRLRILVPGFFASELLVVRLAKFCATFPEIDIHIETTESGPHAHPSTVDVSILVADSPAGGLRVEPLFPATRTAVCAREHAATVTRLGTRVFDEFALIVHKSEPLAWTTWAQEVGIQTSEPRNVIELDTASAVVRAAETGLGIALVSKALCTAHFHRGTLARIFPAELPSAESYCVVCRSKDSARREIAAFLEWAIAEFRGADGENHSAVDQKDSIADQEVPP